MLAISQIMAKEELDLNQKFWLMSLASDEPGKIREEGYFASLEELIRKTAAGSKIKFFQPQNKSDGYHSFDIKSKDGFHLGHLWLAYFGRPVRHYYLVYFEISPLFRRQGLGVEVLKSFQDFLKEKKAIGILDNIIPEEDPTFLIYKKSGWRAVKDLAGQDESAGNYMIYESAGAKRLKACIIKRIIYRLRRRRTAIDIKANEMMVKETINEFKNIYQSLVVYFKDEIDKGGHTTLARFMFTRLVVRLAQFRRRIESLVGYTGGQAVEQVMIDKKIKIMPAQPYLPVVGKESVSYQGSKSLWLELSDKLKTNATAYIEALPNYQRPILNEWLKGKGKSSDYVFTIGDILELGFDPTRLKQLMIKGERYIIERLQPSVYFDLLEKQKRLEEIGREMRNLNNQKTKILVNPVLLILKTARYIYAFRRQIEGIHFEEALEQLCAPRLAKLNQQIMASRLATETVKKAAVAICDTRGLSQSWLFENFSFFLPWNLESNQPVLVIDGQTYFEKVWLA